MKRFILSVQLAMIAVCGIAQQKQLTMQDAMSNARTTLAPQNLTQIQFYMAPKIMCTPNVRVMNRCG
jgi:dipeptidyl-peptidase-4